MKKILILGAGTGGTLVANLLAGKLDLKEWSITVIDKSAEHVYQPGLIFIPFKLYEYEGKKDVVKPITDPLSKKVDFVQGEIVSIDHDHKKVETNQGVFEYDWLVCSMGCHIAPDEVDGLEEAMGNDVHTFYTLEGALAFQKAIKNMKEGKLVLNVAEMPIKCPVAPIEFVFLADYYFRMQGVRDQVEISFVTPLEGVFTKPIASRILGEIAAEKQIEVVPKFSIESVDQEKKTIHSYENATLDYDLLCTIPPNLGPDVVADSDIGDATGYIHTDQRTLKSKKAEQVFVIGDNTNVPTSKAGSVVHFQAETVVENIIREINGQKALPSFDGHSNCFIESGFEKAVLIDFNYDMEPLPGTFPMPVIGPFSLLKETHLNHVGKIAFKWFYWNMLLHGRLPDTPFVPTHMSFVGKDVAEAPPIQRAQSRIIGELMSKEVVVVKEGTPVVEAAKLLVKHRVSGLPVVDVDNKLIGIITEADFLSGMDLQSESTLKPIFDLIVHQKRSKKRMGTIVEDLMTPKPITLREEDSLSKAIETMNRNKIKRVVITDEQNFVKGIVSRADLIKIFF
ncbi:MAG: CBS domain-containing protein [SAR324 cluster bacterium]|nr:CBS domain-containing protein [SAR324 cluster bacterium]